MKIELDFTENTNNRIDSYKNGIIIINGESYASSVIVTPEKLLPEWGPESHIDLASQHILQIISLNPEIIIIGTGQNTIQLDHDLTIPMLDAGIGYEIMDTGAACRCYNLLMGEGRKVATGLLQIKT
ncbi:MAG: MTH938/NDUFAF3 family protein [Flavobacteriaceae bacterium]|nr:MTH938/NDUFAF3 family protein [Flavobacteriaceae bacterium]